MKAAENSDDPFGDKQHPPPRIIAAVRAWCRASDDGRMDADQRFQHAVQMVRLYPVATVYLLSIWYGADDPSDQQPDR